MKLDPAFLKTDLVAGFVVFLVALPLCLGIAFASGAPLFAGIISGVIGGIVVGVLSGSHLSVTGPAAGLTAIVLTGLSKLGSFELFLLAVVIAGFFQSLFGFIKAGNLAKHFPSNVIEGMLTGIGIIILLKQIPHALGYDKDSEGDLAFIESKTGHTTFSAIADAINSIHYGAVTVSILCLLILTVFNKIEFFKKQKLLPGSLVAVTAGILLNEFFIATGSILAVEKEHLVSLPVSSNLSEFINRFRFPDFSGITNKSVWILGLTISLVASIETLLCLEAADQTDPFKRKSSSNRELKAQGLGNILSGLIGGLPMTSVIVRTSANIQAGGRTKVATVAHGLFLLFSVILIPTILNKIPLASLAAILLVIGLKLANPNVFISMWQKGKLHFIPFIITVLGVVFTDLLKGAGIGLAVYFVLRLTTNTKWLASNIKNGIED